MPVTAAWATEATTSVAEIPANPAMNHAVTDRAPESCHRGMAGNIDSLNDFLELRGNQAHQGHGSFVRESLLQ
jgi:hypothetical protein